VSNGYGSPVATYVAGQGTLMLNTPTYSVAQPNTASFGHGHSHYRYEGAGPRVADENTFFVRNPAPFA
jgi:hypothetical protein